ncbi:MAG: substrate-binding domain-containing protein [Rhodocyclaceae bacterium]|nr:substrate-binding domain-containing protein [Rhodocyclaceae bacterium]
MNPLIRVALALLLLAGQVIAQAGEAIRIGGTGSALGTMKLLGEAFVRQHREVGTVTILPSLGSPGGLSALDAGVADVAVTSRPLRERERRPYQRVIEYGRSPFALVTNRTDIAELTMRQVADMLSGRTTHWPDGQLVRIVLRPESDGDSRYLADMAPEIAAALELAHQRPGMIVAPTDQDAADQAERQPGSLATNTVALLRSEGRRLHTIALDGAHPTARALADGSYRFYKPFFMVIRNDAPPGVAAFAEFVQGDEARSILEANGHLVAN